MLMLPRGKWFMSAKPWQQWLERAASNLARAKLGKLSKAILYEDLCFDAQQCCEKALKGLLIYLGLTFPRTHSIGHLLALLEQSGKLDIPGEIKDAAILTDYAVTTRYPGDWEPVDAVEYQQAVELSGKVYEWVNWIIEQA
jgi:HEPN domain-containing protein